MQHLIHDDAQWPYIYFLVVCFLSCDFRRHIWIGADSGLPEAELINEAEIDDFYSLLLSVDENIFWF